MEFFPAYQNQRGEQQQSTRSSCLLLAVIICLISFPSLFLSGCVRYITSRAEINEGADGELAANFAGPTAFFAYDQEQRKRLQDLIDRRTANSERQTGYRVGVGDQIQVEVKNFEEVSRVYRVDLDGTINLPFVGKQKVNGLTDDAIAARVRSAVFDYVLEPQVHVEVIDYSAHKVWIIGGRYQGAGGVRDDLAAGPTSSRRAFPLKRSDYSLIELLVEAGEADLLGGASVIYLFPGGGLHSLSATNADTAARTEVSDSIDECMYRNAMRDSADLKQRDCGNYKPISGKTLEETYSPSARIQIDVEDLFGGVTKAPLHVPLEPGDAVYIPPAATIQVFGEVQRRGQFIAGVGGGNQFIGGAAKPTLFSAISQASGFTYSADIHNVEIYREIEFGQKIVLSVDFQKLVYRQVQDIRLRDGDIVRVPSQASRFTEEHSINAINQALGAGNNVYRTSSQQ